MNGVIGVVTQPESSNLALSKSVEQSTTKHGGVAARAVDGDTNGV